MIDGKSSKIAYKFCQNDFIHNFLILISAIPTNTYLIMKSEMLHYFSVVYLLSIQMITVEANKCVEVKC